MSDLRCVPLVRNGREMKQFAEKLRLHFAVGDSTHNRAAASFALTRRI